MRENARRRRANAPGTVNLDRRSTVNSVPERSDGTAPKRNPRRPRKPFTIVLFAEEWDVLCERASAHDRDPYQHARWLLRRALGVAPEEPPVECDTVRDGQQAEGER
jgi:hypothetical protein